MLEIFGHVIIFLCNKNLNEKSAQKREKINRRLESAKILLIRENAKSIVFLKKKQCKIIQTRQILNGISDISQRNAVGSGFKRVIYFSKCLPDGQSLRAELSKSSAFFLARGKKNEFCFRPRAACKWRSYDPRSPRSQLYKIFLFSRQNGVGMGLGGVGLGAGSLSNQYSREPCLAADATKCISLARSTHVHAFATYFFSFIYANSLAAHAKFVCALVFRGSFSYQIVLQIERYLLALLNQFLCPIVLYNALQIRAYA